MILLSASTEDINDTINSMNTSVMVFSVESDDRFVVTALNEAAKRSFQARPNIVGMTVQEIQFDQATRDRVQGSFMRCRETRATVSSETRFNLPDGTTRWMNSILVPVLDDAGDVASVVVTSLDISQLVETRRAMERSLSTLASGFVSICAWCNKIQADEDWVTVEDYLQADDATGDVVVCPDCSRDGS